MSMPNEFLVTLVSGANEDMFPDNKINRFTTKLDSPINLGDYEVGLVMIQYPLSWQNVSKGEFVLLYGMTMMQLSTPAGRYKDMAELCETVNSKFASVNHSTDLKLSFNRVTSKVELNIDNPDMHIIFGESLANTLGFEERKRCDSGETVGYKIADIDAGMTALFVYTNIIQSQLVGDTRAPLLRVVPLIGGSKNRYQAEEFMHVHYLPTINTNTDLITVDIRRDNGSAVSFMSGKLIAKLRFRKIR